MQEYKKFALAIAEEAGKIMKEYFVVGMVRQEKEDTSPVTAADLKINSILIKKVSKLFPSHSVLGEEESNIVKGSEYIWVCDPIDGTIPYSLGLPISVFSLALVKNGEVILAVVYDPFCDRLYYAEKGKGAYLNNKKIHVSNASTLEKAKIEYEMWNRSKYDLQPLVNELKKYNTFLMKFSSYVNPSVLVAAGEIRATKFPHTTAPTAPSVKNII